MPEERDPHQRQVRGIFPKRLDHLDQVECQSGLQAASGSHQPRREEQRGPVNGREAFGEEGGGVREKQDKIKRNETIGFAEISGIHPCM